MTIEAQLIELPTSRYVSIQHDGIQLDCAIQNGLRPAESMRNTSLGLKVRIDRLTKQAAALDLAATQMESVA